jgi:hypothetical protein
MAYKDDQILRTAKEIIVKFIEVGRVSPTNFDGSFKEIYRSVYEAANQIDDSINPPEKE